VVVFEVVVGLIVVAIFEVVVGLIVVAIFEVVVDVIVGCDIVLGSVSVSSTGNCL
jgi:hypothetical protein